MKKTSPLRRLAFISALSAAFTPLVPAQSVNLPAKESTRSENAQTWAAEALSLFERIKAGDSPTLRAWLYSRTATWLAESRETALQQEALRVALAGLADIQEHEKEIPATPVAVSRRQLLSVIKKLSPETAQQVEQRYSAQASTAEKRPSLSTALSELNNTQTSERALARAVALIRSGSISSQEMLGAMLRLRRQQSAALSPLLSAVLDLAEQSPHAIAFHAWSFFSGLYMAETMPAQLRLRFWQVIVRTAQARSSDLKSDHVERSSAAHLLQLLLPEMQKQAPVTYAEAASVLAAIAPPQSSEAREYGAAAGRIKESTDPVLQAKTEARAAVEKYQKRSLLELGSLLARRKGDLMGAAELLVEAKRVVGASPENYSEAEAYLSEIGRDAIERGEVKAARFVIEHLGLPLLRVDTLRLLALYFIKVKDSQMAGETLDEASKILRDAAPGPERALAYFQLAADWRTVDESRARQLTLEAVKATNNVPRPDKDAQGAFGFSLWPLAEAVRQAFNDLARRDRGDALGLSEDFRSKEMGAAARLGVYQSYDLPGAQRR